MNIAFWIDPLTHLAPKKDSSVAMIESALAREWNCFYFTQQDLYVLAGVPYARLTSIKAISAEKPAQASLGKISDRPLTEMDIILIRKDPPVDNEYLYATYLLELAARLGVLVSNRPQGLRDANEKCFTLNFPECCPATLVTQNIERLRAFWETHRDVIFKPLSGMGGRSVFHVAPDGRNVGVILETLTLSGTVTIMAQQYIPAIREAGDKRILLIQGQPLDYALARIPSPHDFRGNLAAGATGHVVSITARDRFICEHIAPALREKGLDFVGIDVIGEYLTEVNVTSPTCIREIVAETGLDIAGEYLSALAKQLKK
jgi:glutathione synthase